MQPQQPIQEKPKIHWIWWIIAVGLLIWNFLSFLPKSRPEISHPLQHFYPAGHTGNVTSVHISGSEITGKFANAILDPLSTLLYRRVGMLSLLLQHRIIMRIL